MSAIGTQLINLRETEHSSIHSVDCQLELFHLFLLGYELQARMEVQHCNVIERLIEVTENENLPT
jgi:hypothetical protein